MANITIDKEELIKIITDLMDEELDLEYFFSSADIIYGNFVEKLTEKLNTYTNGNN